MGTVALILLIAVGVLLIFVSVYLREEQKAEGPAAIIILCVILAGIGAGMLNASTKKDSQGQTAPTSELEPGLYAIHGTLQIGDDVALWLAPLDSARDLEHGRLYLLPKGAKKEFGHYLKKNDAGELLAYTFETGK